MYTVGDGATHQRFLDTLARGGHSYTSYADLWFDGVKIGELSTGDQIESGTVRVTARNRERRSLELIAHEDLWPIEVSDLLSPYGVWVTVRVRIAAGLDVFPDIPVFAGKIAKVRRQRWSGQIAVSAVDPMWQVNKEAIETPRPAPTVTIVYGIQTLLAEVFPQATLTDYTGSQATIPSSTLWNAGAGSRGKAMDELATSLGAELFALPTVPAPGGSFVLRPVPALQDAIAWTLPDGALSVVVDDQQTQSGAGLVNRWIVTVERPDAPPIYVTVSDDDVGSATRYGGPMGHLPDFLSSPLITDESQAQQAGRAKLDRTKGLARTRQVTVVANPALEAGDVLYIGVDGEAAETHITDDFDLPLTPVNPAMTIQTRSTVADE